MKMGLNKMHVIYAEDETMIRETVSSFLKKMLFPNLHEVADGQEAIDKFHELKNQGISVDLIITDITMPEVDGFEFIEHVRQYNEDLFALIISGLDFGPYFKKINAVSVRTQYLNKPVDLNTLMQKLHEMIEKVNKQKDLKFAQNLAEQYKIAIDKSATVSKTDVDGKITYVNDKFLEISGYSLNELIGSTHAILRAPFVEDEVYQNMWETILDKKIYIYENLPNKAKDGTIYYVNTTIIPILDLNNEIIEFLSIRFDNTAVIRSLEEEKKAKETQASFLANMSHEIRTPLNAIIGFTKLLKESNLDDKDTEYVQIVNDNAHLLVKTIGEILDFSKIRSGKMDIEHIYFDPYKEFNSIKNLFTAVANEKGVNLILKIDPKLEKYLINSDIIKIKQVVSNLLSNAIKFTQIDGKVEFGIKVDKIIDKKLVLKFVVKDNGVGIENDKLQDIFKPFTQENQSTTRQYGGTGLGLSICKEIIELLGSELHVISKKNYGSMFYFNLDLDCKEKPTQKTINSTKAIIDNSKLAFKNAKVLVAEDVVINQKLLDALLKKVGIEADFVINGKEAVDYFENKEGKIDLIFLDINMPIMDGMEALKNILKLQKTFDTKVPIIALTANAVKGDKEKFLSAGFDSYISKPINFDLLTSNLKSFLKDLITKKEETKVIEQKVVNHIPENKKEEVVDEINLQKIADSINLPYEFYLELLGDFVNSIDTEMNILNNHWQSSKMNDFKNQAHKLKGLCGNLGFDPLFEIFKELETNQNQDKADELINNAKNIINSVKSKINN